MRSVRRLLFSLLAVGVAASTGACAAPSEEEAADDDASAFSDADTSCYAQAPRRGESLTEARARCLTAYADWLLDAQVKRAEDPRDEALEGFKGKLRVPAETGCFTEDIPGGYGGVWQNDIDSKRDVGALAVQLKAAIEFLKYVYRDLDEYPNHFFQSVEICPSAQLGGDLVLTGSRLQIGVRTGYFGRVGVHTATELRDRWSEGEHLTRGLEELRGVRWTLLDPVGTPRTLLRAALRRIVARVTDRLDALEGAPEATLRSELTRIIEDETSSAGDEQRPSVRERALEAIASMSASRLASLLTSWKLEIAKPETIEGAEEGAVSMRDVLQSRDVRVNVTQRGLINVQNYKQISVSTEAFLPRASFSRYVEAVKAQTDVDVEQLGLVNVQLNDVVDVKVQVLHGKAAQTGSLDRVLGR